MEGGGRFAASRLFLRASLEEKPKVHNRLAAPSEGAAFCYPTHGFMGFFDWFKKKRPVLVVDDDLMVRTMIKDALSSFDLEIILGCTGKEGVDLAAQHRPQLILLDMRMPVMGGLDALLLLKSRAQTKEIPVLMVTAEQKGKDVEEAFTRGAAGYVIKPIVIVRLLEKIREFIKLPEK